MVHTNYKTFTKLNIVKSAEIKSLLKKIIQKTQLNRVTKVKKSKNLESLKIITYTKNVQKGLSVRKWQELKHSMAVNEKNGILEIRNAKIFSHDICKHLQIYRAFTLSFLLLLYKPWHGGRLKSRHALCMMTSIPFSGWEPRPQTHMSI